MKLLTGFVQSLEFLKKSWDLPSNFPDLEKVWKIEINYGENGKSLKLLFFFQSFKKCFIRELVFVLVKSYSTSPVCLQCTTRKALFVRFLRLLLITYLLNLESAKEVTFWEKVWNKCWILDLKSCTNPVLFFCRSEKQFKTSTGKIWSRSTNTRSPFAVYRKRDSKSLYVYGGGSFSQRFWCWS